MTRHELVIIGGGPAGMSAAALAARLGLDTLLIEEGSVLGGRLPGQLHEEYQEGVRPGDTAPWWNGREQAATLVKQVHEAGVKVRPSTVVWGINRALQVFVHDQAVAGVAQLDEPRPVERVQANAVILATGGQQQPIVFPGWTLPGVLNVGGAQRLLTDYVRPGRRVLIVGPNTLGFALLRQLRLVDVDVAGVVMPPHNGLNGILGEPRHAFDELVRLSQLAPSRALQSIGRFMRGGLAAEVGLRLYPRQGVKVWDTPIMMRRALVEVTGDAGIERAILADIDVDGTAMSARDEIEVDAVITSGGLSPLAELARVAGCEFAFEEDLGGWIPLYGPNLETTVPGLYVAGNITGIEGARVAMAQGTLAGLAAAVQLEVVGRGVAGQQLAAARAGVADARSKSALQFYAGTAQARANVEHRWQRGKL